MPEGTIWAKHPIVGDVKFSQLTSRQIDIINHYNILFKQNNLSVKKGKKIKDVKA